ncbi:MAG: hypothetical protein ABR999_10700 [Methanoregula sp.]|jgi:hypothetical protein|uniref:hypothetical protein n=1 Tax=Methanoregula sp. TaxID=2052170 RepID=UPI003D0D9413
MSKRSQIRSRCQCGHQIIKIDGEWLHVQPHPEHACACKNPAPGLIDHRLGAKPPKTTAAGICCNSDSMLRKGDTGYGGTC